MSRDSMSILEEISIRLQKFAYRWYHDIHDCVTGWTLGNFCYPKVYQNSATQRRNVDRPRQRFRRCARNVWCYMRGQFHRACECRSILALKRREKEREGERKSERRKKKRGVGYTTAVSPRGIRVLDSHPRLRPSPLFSSPMSLYLSLSSAVSLHLPSGSSFIESPDSVYRGIREERRGEGEIQGGRNHGGNDGFAISQRYQLG